MVLTFEFWRLGLRRSCPLQGPRSQNAKKKKKSRLATACFKNAVRMVGGSVRAPCWTAHLQGGFRSSSSAKSLGSARNLLGVPWVPLGHLGAQAAGPWGPNEPQWTPWAPVGTRPGHPLKQAPHSGTPAGHLPGGPSNSGTLLRAGLGHPVWANKVEGIFFSIFSTENCHLRSGTA